MKNINFDFQKLVPHLIAILVFVVVAFIYFSPVIEGKRLKQHDIQQFQGMAKEINDYRAKFDGEEPLWTNSMFGGMPAYQISVRHGSNLIQYIDKMFRLGLPHPVNILLLYMLGFYILLMCMKVDPWLGIVGALAFAFSSYYLVIIGAGHNSKAIAIAYAAPALGGVLLTYRGKLLLGAAVTALFMALELTANHMQITYYLGIMLVFVGIAEFVRALQNNKLPHFLKSSVVLGVAMVLAVLCTSSNIMTTYEYSKYTTRGKTELTIKADGTSNADIVTSGLDRAYVTQWSYGTGETATLLIPNAKGGASSGVMIGDEDLMNTASPQLRSYLVSEYQKYAEGKPGHLVNNYWGNQGSTAGPVYIGAIVIFLFILGMVFLKDELKWALLATAILCVMLSWGKNFMGLTNFFLDYIPGYNKFRAVTIILSIVGLAFPVLAMLMMKKMMDDKPFMAARIKPFMIVTGAVVGVILILVAIPETFFNFLSNSDIARINAYASNPASGYNAAQMTAVAEQIKEVRIGVFRGDALRSILFILLAAGAIFAYLKDKLKHKYALIAVLGVLILVDQWSVDKRYVNNATNDQKQYISWTDKAQVKKPHNASQADIQLLQMEMAQHPELQTNINNRLEQIKAEKRANNEKNMMVTPQEQEDISFSELNFATNYRVMNITVSTFNDASTSYFHKSIGGYHGAKLKRYQELIEFNISREMSSVVGGINSGNPATGFVNANALNMLNCKYVIYHPQAPPAVNPHALGNAWFVQQVQVVDNADKEIQAIKGITPATTALLDQRYADYLGGTTSFNKNGTIEQVGYNPNHMVYQSNSTADQFAVFSEVYYDNGWNAYIDGQPAEYVRTNYLLRGMKVPAGEHTIEFKFEPSSYSTGSTVSLASSALLILLFLGVVLKELLAPKEEAA